MGFRVWGLGFRISILSITLRTLNHGTYGLFRIMGNAGFVSSAPPPPHFILGRAGARRRSIAVLRNDVKGLGFRGVIACLSFLAGMFE